MEGKRNKQPIIFTDKINDKLVRSKLLRGLRSGQTNLKTFKHILNDDTYGPTQTDTELAHHLFGCACVISQKVFPFLAFRTTSLTCLTQTFHKYTCEMASTQRLMASYVVLVQKRRDLDRLKVQKASHRNHLF